MERLLAEECRTASATVLGQLAADTLHDLVLPPSALLPGARHPVIFVWSSGARQRLRARVGSRP